MNSQIANILSIWLQIITPPFPFHLNSFANVLPAPIGTSLALWTRMGSIHTNASPATEHVDDFMHMFVSSCHLCEDITNIHGSLFFLERSHQIKLPCHESLSRGWPSNPSMVWMSESPPVHCTLYIKPLVQPCFHKEFEKIRVNAAVNSIHSEI